VADIRSKHLRTCSVLEALIDAYLYGGAMIPGLGKPQHVNITIQRTINVPPGREPEPKISEGEWDRWVRFYEDTWLFTPVKIGDRRYRLYPV